MFIGHFAVALAAKRVAPRTSLGATFVAATLVDLLWPIFLLLGWEEVRLTTNTNPFLMLAFIRYPWSHSLLMGVVWGIVLGAVYFAKGDNDKAAAQFTRALAARPGAAAPMLGLAKVHFSKGETDKALALFDEIVAKHPGTPEATQAAAFIKELRKGP